MLEPGDKISVLRVDVRHENGSGVLTIITKHRVICVDAVAGLQAVRYDDGGVSQWRRLDDEGVWWCRGWDQEAGAALIAARLLIASAT